ncbi:MAG TPA: TraR/DksA family transcriptional regulator [Gammaproteobacteria bacterium]
MQRSEDRDGSDIDFAEFEARLRERQRALFADLQREVAKHRGQQQADLLEQADPDDRAVADLLSHLNLSEIDRDVDELRAIQAALGRIASGSYGICQSCGRPIGVERLRAIPETPLCVECQARAERLRESTPSL